MRMPRTRLVRAPRRRPPRTPDSSAVGAGRSRQTRTLLMRQVRALPARRRRIQGSDRRPAPRRAAKKDSKGGPPAMRRVPTAWMGLSPAVGPAAADELQNHVVGRVTAAARADAEWILRLLHLPLNQPHEQL